MSGDVQHLVIGGTGVIGHFVTRQLVERGHHPVVMTLSGNTDLIADVVDCTTVVRGDIVEAEAFDKMVARHGVTHIVHLGAFNWPERDPHKGVRVGVDGMINVMEAARVNGVKRVVYTSTKGVYGPVTGEFAHPTYRPLTEDLPTVPATIRSTMKLAGEHIGRIYQTRYGIEFTSVRFSSTVGPAKIQRHGSTSVHSRIIENAMLGVPARIEKGGDAVTDTIYNDDAAQGIVRALEAPAPLNPVYNIGCGYGITLHQFADVVRDSYPGAQIDIGPGTQYLPVETSGHCILDIARARHELGFEPRYDASGLVRAYAQTMERLGIEPVKS